MKEFALEDILSVYTGILLTKKGVDGLYKVLDFLTGQNLMTHQLPRATEEVKSNLIKQLSFLDSPEFDFAVCTLKECLDSKSGQKDKEALCLGWLAKQETKYGKSIKLSSCENSYKPINPIIEICEMIGK